MSKSPPDEPLGRPCVAPPQRRYVGEFRHIVVVMWTGDVFVALAPVRPRLLLILANRPRPAGALGAQFALSRTALAEHLNGVRDAGLMYDEVSGRHRNYCLAAEPLVDMRESLHPLERYGRGRLRGLANSLMSAAAVAIALCAGCANEPDEPAAAPVGSAPPTTTTASHSKYPGGPLMTVIVPNPEFTGGAEILRATLPNWAVLEDPQSPATRGWIGYPAGGSLDLPLRFDVAFEGTIDDMKPPTEKGCYHHGDPPYPAESIEDITAQIGDGTGFRKMGDRTAEYRVWQANCPNEREPQIHQAWLLPDSDIAIYEQRATEFNDAVVQSMQLLR